MKKGRIMSLDYHEEVASGEWFVADGKELTVE